MHLDGALDVEELPKIKVPTGRAKAVADTIMRQVEAVQAHEPARAPEAVPPVESQMAR